MSLFLEGDTLTRVLNKPPSSLSSEQQGQLEDVYQQLKRIARGQRLKFGRSTLHTTELVNEAWLKSKGTNRTFADRNHFFAYCAVAMRHILIDQARRNRLVTYVDDEAAFADHPVYKQSDYLLELEKQLENLGTHSRRLERIFTFRFFGDMAFETIAEVLEVSERTVLRDWKKARAMLAVAMAD